MLRLDRATRHYLDHIYARERARLRVLALIAAPMLLCFVSMQAALGTRPAAYWFSNPLLYAGLAGFGLLSLYMRRIGSALPFAWMGVAMLSLYALACALTMEPTPRMAMLSLPWFIVIPLVATPFWTYLPLSMLSQAGCALAACLAFWRSGADGPLWMAFGMQVVLGIVAAALVFHVMEHGRRNHYRAEMELERLSRIDPLTQVMNRRHFIETGEALLADAPPGMPLTACFLDMDHFKRLNDEGSHRIGDMILVEAARCLKRHEDGGIAVGRLGGEEFGMLMPGMDLAQAVGLLEELRARIAMIAVEGFSTTASSGVAERQAGESLPDLLHRADLALLQAKRGGRNRVVAAHGPAGAPDATAGAALHGEGT